MKSTGQGKTTSGPLKDKSNKDADKIAQGTSVKSKAAKGLGCRKSGTSVGKTCKQRSKTTGNNKRNCLHLSATPLLHPQPPVMTSNSTQNSPPNIRLQSPLQIQKFQLQLFPIDEPTRKFLEEENHCPYLELTIPIKKKIASVIKHLNIKWGNSTSASEELILFPYNARVESLESSKRWSLKDSDITAAEVHAAIGKPAVFRLRYGWLNILEPKINNLSRTYDNLARQLTSKETQKKDADDQEKRPSSVVGEECGPLPIERVLKQDVRQTALLKSIQPADNQRSHDDAKLSWVDCLSNMSFGALFSQVEAAEGAELSRQVPQQQVPISCDSFDAAIAAHFTRHRPGNQSTTMTQPSILDAEETCNPFSFHNFTRSKENTVQSGDVPVTSSSQNVEHHTVKLCKLPKSLVEPAQNDGFVPPNTTLTSEDDVQPIRKEDTHLVVDSQGNKQDEEQIQVNTNATDNVDNQFEGLDKHWPSSLVEPAQNDAQPIREEDTQLVLNSQGNKHEDEKMQIDINATNKADNQFEGLDMHWPPSAGPWQFATSSQQISSDSNGINGFVSTSLDIF